MGSLINTKTGYLSLATTTGLITVNEWHNTNGTFGGLLQAHCDR